MKKYLKILAVCSFLVASVLYLRAGTAPSVPTSEEPVAQAFTKPVVLRGGAFDQVSLEQAMETIDDYVENGYVDSIVRALKGTSAERVREIANKVVAQQDSELARDDKLQLLYGLSLNLEDESSNLFQLIFDHGLMQEGAPLLYVAADGNYATIVPRLEEWALLESKKGAALDQAIEHAVEQNNANVLRVLRNYNLAPSKSYATEMLIHAAQHDAGQEVARELIRNGADVNFSQEGMTPLIIAVRYSNLPLVGTLVKVPGIEINKVIDGAVGSALQQLLDKDVMTDADNAIEALLREHGAVE